MKHLQRILVGALILCALGFLVTGPDVFGLLYLLIVCTFGLGLIPLLFADWLVGWLVLSMFGAAAGQGESPAGS